MKKTVNKLSEILSLPIGTKLYRATQTDIEWWYFAGENPKSKGSIMLISAGNMQRIHGEYIGDSEILPYYLNYNQACKELLKNAERNVKTIQKIFIDKQ